jgi:hypothetical protein
MDKCQPYDYPHMTNKEKITSLLLSGIQRSANYGSFNTLGELFKEVDRMLDLVIIKEEVVHTVQCSYPAEYIGEEE